MLFSMSAVCNGVDQVYMTDSMSGNWLELPAINGFADISTSGFDYGNCNKYQWTTTITNKVSIGFFDKEITKTASPVTSNIRTIGENAFEVPMGEVATWRVRIKVINTGTTEITDTSVHDNFGAEFSVSVDGKSQGTVDIELKGKAKKVQLVWNIGRLAVGASAWLDLIVSTKQNPAGKQEFTSPGDCQMNSGATLKYYRGNKQFSATSNTILVRAVPKSQFEPNKLTNSKSAFVFRGSSTVIFSEEFQPITSSINTCSNRGKYPFGFEVPEDTRLEWRAVITIKNISDKTIENVRVTEHLGAELDVLQGSAETVPGLKKPGESTPYSTLDIIRVGNIKITWTVSEIKPGKEANMTFLIYTVQKNGKQLYSEPTLCEDDPEFLNSGATLKYDLNGCQNSKSCNPVPVWVTCSDILIVTIDANRYDWQIKKPGVYAAEPILVKVSSNKRVAVDFSSFNDLVNIEMSNEIPTYYGFGDSLDIVEKSGWIRADALNATTIKTPKTMDGSVWSWKLWSKLHVNSGLKASEYKDTGILTFTVMTNSPYISE